MKIGIIGSAVVGQALGAGFLKHGHEVMLGSRDPKKPELQKWLSANSGARGGTFQDVARFGELVVLATAGGAATNAIALAGPANLAGKTILDTTNPIAGAPVNGILPFTTGPNESLAEQVQAAAPDSHVVKAFNSVGSGLMVDPHFEQGKPTMFYCGNDARAKEQVAGIISAFGWEPYDCGDLTAARALEPLCILWCLPGFQRNDWRHAFKVVSA